MAEGKITKVGMLIIVESNLLSAIDFYKDLGFHLKFHLKDKWAEFELGDVKFGLAPTTAEVQDRHTGIILEVDDMKLVRENLKVKNVSFVREPVEAVHGIMASIKDPGGNILDLYQPTPEKVADLVKKVKEEEEKAAQETKPKEN